MRVAGGFELEFVLPLETVALTIGGAVAVCVTAVALQRALEHHGIARTREENAS